MKLAGLHPDEQRRLQSLRSSGLLNSGKEERFDRLTRLARSLYNLPVASISLVGEDLLHIKSCAGLDVDTVPRDISFCAHTILQTDPLIVNDMQQDERFHDNPLVIEAPFIRFYAGYPVQLPDGATVGSFCLMDHQPRSFSAHEMQILSDLAAIVEDEFKVLDAATSDELTGLFNRRGFLTLAEYVDAGKDFLRIAQAQLGHHHHRLRRRGIHGVDDRFPLVLAFFREAVQQINLRPAARAFRQTPYQTTEFAEERIAKGWRRQRNTGEGKDPQPGAPVARQ